jgi:hypothetical protein
MEETEAQRKIKRRGNTKWGSPEERNNGELEGKRQVNIYT